ncbi:hypothetical protein J7E32_13385 [Bacillus sp. ISL-55]|nr:hypothetical protein [Bacillus sp. ISL-55]
MTGLGVSGEKLSRKSRYCDRFGGERGKIIIVTGLRVGMEKLSRKSRYYDRFGGERGKAVKKKP